jgi:hypothetical protein
MIMRQFAILAFTAVSCSAFTSQSPRVAPSSNTYLFSSVLTKDDASYEASLEADIKRELNYQPGKANTEFARRYGNLAGKKVKTVGEAFADFTKELGFSINALYKNMITDTVGITHLTVVNARFERDAIWCLGITSALDLLLKNYPDAEVKDAIMKALFKSVGMEEDDVRAQGKIILDWAQGKTKEDVEAALRGEGDSPVAQIAKKVAADDFWFYSRYFGLGLLKIMDVVGIEQDKDEVYPIMEEWMKLINKSSLSACSDSDLYFKVKDKLDMMETMMKEIEIREKKRMAERLEEKAEAALRAAEREEKFQAEITAEKDGKVEAKEETTA